MNYKSFPIGVHVNENSVKVLEGIVQNDNANLFQVQLYDGTEAFDFTGYNIINATIIRPDETCITDLWVEGLDGYEPADESTVSEVESHTFLAIQYLDPENGRITLQVGGEATAQAGLHRMALEIYSGSALLTTARINYNVVESLNKIGASILTSSDDYVALQELLLKIAQIDEAEQERVNQEAAREQSVAEMLATLDEYMTTIGESVAACEAAAASAEEWAGTAQATSEEEFPQAVQDALESLGAISSFVNSHLSTNGHYVPPTVTVATIDQFFAQNSDAGIVAYNSTDDALYVGTGNRNYTVVADPDAFPGYVVSVTAPSDHDCLWIDSVHGYQMKYYQGSAWQPVKTVAVFG